jgi:hypothetical protein
VILQPPGSSGARLPEAFKADRRRRRVPVIAPTSTTPTRS